MRPWLSVIGIGEDGLDGLSPAARTLIDSAETLIGGARHLAMVPHDGRERLAWPSPMADLLEAIPRMRGRRVAVLASGDPMWFGVGASLVRRVAPEEMTVLPSPSAFQLAAARLGWALDECATLSLHGRRVEALALHVQPGARLLLLAHDGNTPAQVSEWLVKHGFGNSRMTALAHLGGPREARLDATASTWSAEVPDLHVLAVECLAAPDAQWWPRTAGLPDEAFAHDGQLTKREARALALARLMPHAHAVLWDVGAGCGSIAIEWLRAAPHGAAVALEPSAERRALAARNAAALGVPHLAILDRRAPDGLGGLEPPDAIFIGGGLSGETAALAVERLKPGGRLVAHAVSLESEALLIELHACHGGDLTRLSVARAEPLGARRGWRPMMPLTQWAWAKP
jgi:precorrin-6B C5,15-methyltransferase / cobalt-precorrin-6B C5,C15-methyltransferase